VTSTDTDPLPSEETEDIATEPMPKTRHRLRETAMVVAVALLVAVLLRLFVVQTYFIPSVSMEPTLRVGDHIAVNKLSYDFHGIHRGDIVVFSRPAAEHCGGPVVPDLVKRIVGLPGETISLSGHGHVLIDGATLPETDLPASEQGITYPGPPGTPYDLSRPFKIPPNDYFVMGDNRKNSCDSRYWGPIRKSSIVGKVDLRIWPLTAWRFF
jgi:signal peptidase I